MVIVQNGEIILGCKNFKYFFGVLDVANIFLSKQ